MAISIYESFRAVFYTPFYLPHILGAYEAEGLDVRLGTSPDLGTVAAQLREGEADVYWGGPMRIMVNYDRDPDCDIVGFCEAIARDPFFLIGRELRPDFEFRALQSVRLATVSEVPTPWMCLQDDLRRAGIDPGSVERITDGSMADNAEALREGRIDVVQTFQPFVEALLRDGVGHIWYAAADRGPCTYTTFYALRSTLDSEFDVPLRMTRAMYRCQKWLHAQPAPEIAVAVREFFGDCPLDLLAASIDRYLALGVWSRNPRIPRRSFERLRTALLSGGLIGREIPYEQCVDVRFADQVIAEDPPAMRSAAGRPG